MADLKELLGDAFKEDMTIDEVNVVLAERELVDKSQFEGFVPKTLLEKANSEAADFKKKWKATQSEVEQRAIDEAEKQETVEAELKALRRTTTLTKYEKEYLAIGYDDKTAKEVSEAMCDGDMDTVFGIQKRFNENQQKAIKADLMKNMPNSPSGNETKIDYSKQIAEAQSTGNMALVASLIRQQTAANAPKE